MCCSDRLNSPPKAAGHFGNRRRTYMDVCCYSGAPREPKSSRPPSYPLQFLLALLTVPSQVVHCRRRYAIADRIGGELQSTSMALGLVEALHRSSTDDVPPVNSECTVVIPWRASHIL